MTIRKSGFFHNNIKDKAGHYFGLGFFAILLIAVIVIYGNFRADMNSANAGIDSIRTEIFASKFGNVEYCIEDKGTSILVLHGENGGIDQGKRLARQFGFADKGYQLIYVSRFGYLKSNISIDSSPRKQAEAYKLLLDYLGIDRVFVYAYSAAGSSAMWFAIDYPEYTKGLILQSSTVPGPPLSPHSQALFKYDLLYWAAIKITPNNFVKEYLPEKNRNFFTGEEEDTLVENILISSLPVSKRTFGIIFDSDISNPSVNYLLFERIKAPTLLMQGTDNLREKNGAAMMAERIPNCRFVELQGGHFLLKQEPKIQSEILHFLEENKTFIE